jgi:hypothetical protein
MRRPKYRREARSSTRFSGRRRIVAAVATLVAFGGVVTVTQVSDASTKRGTAGGDASPTPSSSIGAGEGTGDQQDGDDGGQTQPPGSGLGILTNSCDTSNLEDHDGFQKGDRCVSTEFGEVGSEANNPTLLITAAPEQVDVGEPFTLKVSTRNLVRDRFLGAAAGGYYVESSVLTDAGLVRGHFHTACRMLSSTRKANDPAPVPAFFVATEDKQGGATPDTVTIQVPGMPTAGTAQCASWAGDGSHRIPMMQRANQTPAFDAVRIQVRAGEQPPPADDQPSADNGGGDQPPADNGGGDQPPADNGGGDQPPADNDGGDQPPADNDGEDPVDDGNTGENPPPAEDEDDGAPAPTNPTTDPPAPAPADPTANPPAPAPAAPTDVPAKQPITNATVQRDIPRPATTTAGTSSSNTGSSTTGSSNAGSSGSPSSDQDSTADVALAAPRSVARESMSNNGATADKPEAAPSSKAAAANVQDDDAGAPDEAADTLAAVPTPHPASANRLTLSGVNSVAIFCGGALLVLVGLIAVKSMRRRRPRLHSRRR